jgi:hypothetical protein
VTGDGSSYNGWPATSTGAGIDSGFTAAGLRFPGGVREGDCSTVFRWLVERLVTVDPPLTDPDTGAPGFGCWGWSYRANVNNPSTLSCHSSGTAIDYSAPSHPNGGPAYGGFSDEAIAAIYGWLDDLQGAVQWGADYSGTKDPMHFEVIVDAAALAAVAATLPDGGDPPTPIPLPPPEDLMPLIVKRADGVDYAWSDTLSVFLRIPTVDYYNLLLSADVIEPDHGAADPCGADLVEWIKGQVAAAGGTVYEPTQ